MNVLLINGPNLNMLGLRDHSLYGTMNTDDIVKEIRAQSIELGVHLDYYQVEFTLNVKIRTEQ